MLFPWTSPKLRSSLSPLILLDYAANPPALLQGQPRKSCNVLRLVLFPLKWVVSPCLQLAGRVNSLWKCSRSVTACNGSHTIPTLTPPGGCSSLTPQCTYSCYSHTAGGLANWSPLPAKEGSPARTRCWNTLILLPVRVGFSSRGHSLSCEKALETCIIQTCCCNVLSLLKLTFLL